MASRGRLELRCASHGTRRGISPVSSGGPSRGGEQLREDSQVTLAARQVTRDGSKMHAAPEPRRTLVESRDMENVSVIH